ncbi:hypothetical protein L218DRAFT_936113 [Marasmius fiardii PR-910]|nr:hypothetical protein L218DRAFT_936113 [Marasmius fiardii PR-910]
MWKLDDNDVPGVDPRFAIFEQWKSVYGQISFPPTPHEEKVPIWLSPSSPSTASAYGSSISVEITADLDGSDGSDADGGMQVLNGLDVPVSVSEDEYEYDGDGEGYDGGDGNEWIDVDVRAIIVRGIISDESAESIPLPVPAVDCLACTESIPTSSSFSLPCGHTYCLSCTETLLTLSLNGPSPRCCDRYSPIDLEMAISDERLDPDLRIRIRERLQEHSVPPAQRLYCPNPQCSAFLGSMRSQFRIRRTVTCGACSTRLRISLSYRRRRQNEHDQLRLLAGSRKWKKCPCCHQMIEKTDGCNHMTCRCGGQFCYKCGGLWYKRSFCHSYVVGWPGMGWTSPVMRTVWRLLR